MIFSVVEIPKKKKWIGVLLIGLHFFWSCSDRPVVTNDLSEGEKQYWFEGLAEINSFRISQSRYGEMRDGESVILFVTEDFSPDLRTKADESSEDNVSVLKMIRIKRFGTGIYDYSVMTSTFFPFSEGLTSLKVSMSAQDWCGHSYMEVLNKNGLQADYYSYFAKERLKNEKLGEVYLEDDIWSWIRLRNKSLPVGSYQFVPSLEYLSLFHKEVKAYEAHTELEVLSDYSLYTIFYTDLERTLSISFENEAPYSISGWAETYNDGDGKPAISSGELMHQMKTDYWNKKSNADSVYHKELKLK